MDDRYEPTTEDGARTFERRDVLGAAGAGLISLVVGCSTSATSSSGRMDVPDFAVDDAAQPTPLLLAAEIVDGGDQISVWDRFTVELAVGNAGGAAIGDRTIEVGTKYISDSETASFGKSVNEPSPRPVELPSIDPGEWKPVEADLPVNAGGDWTIGADCRAHPEFDPRIEVAPARLTVSDTAVSEVGHMEITALEPAFERAVHYHTEEGGIGIFNQDATGLLSAADDHVFPVHRFRIRNTSSERSLGFGQLYSDNRFVNSHLVAEPTATVSADDMRDNLDTLDIDEHGTVFGNNDIAPGQEVDLIAIQEVPEDEVPDATVTLSFWGDTRDILFDTVDEMPPLPRFELVEATISDDDGADPVIEATVRNVGDATGTFRGAGQFYESRPTDSDWVYLPDGMSSTVEPGEQVTLSTVASRGDERFRLVPFETELSL